MSFRVFAAEMVRKMLLTCEGNRTHFDLALAKEAHTANPQSEDTLGLRRLF